jgi:hypothetical protein
LEKEWERGEGVGVVEREGERVGEGVGEGERVGEGVGEGERVGKGVGEGGGGIMIQVQVVFMCIFYFYVSFYSFFYVLFFLFPLRLIIFPVPLLSVSQRNHNKGMGSFYAPLLNVV